MEWIIEQNMIQNDDKNILNIELGAGCGCFGKTYFSKCYTTDIDKKYKDNCQRYCLDFTCSAISLPFGNNRFDKIILCNPYGFGFRDEEDAFLFLSEAIRVLNTKGEIIVIGNEKNAYAKPQNIKRVIDEYMLTEDDKIDISTFIRDIDPSIDYPKYVFYQSDLNLPTIPNKETVIFIDKNVISI